MIRQTKLSCGIDVITDCLEGAASATLGFWNKVGSRDETQTEHGLAHFLEHMFFKGTETYSAKELAQKVDYLGAYFNAYTSKENTAYYIRCMDQHVYDCADIICDIFFNANFPEDELVKERDVVKQEIALYLDTPEDLCDDDLYQAAFGDPSSLGRTILGTKQSLATFTNEALNRFVHKHYYASNVKFIAVGNIDHDMLCKHLEGFIANTNFHQRSKETQTNIDGNNLSEFTPRTYLRGKDLEQNHIAIGYKTTSYHEEDYFTAQLLSVLLGYGDSSYLNQVIREDRGLAYSVYAHQQSYHDTGMLTLYAGTAPEQSQECFVLLKEALNKVSLDEKQLEKAKNQLKSSFLMGMEKSYNRADHWGSQILQYGKLYSLAQTSSQIDTVTLDHLLSYRDSLRALTPAISVVGEVDNMQLGHIDRRL